MAGKKPASKASVGKKAPRGKDRGAEGGDYLVFVSHSSKDAWVAKMLAREIEATGARAWLDVKDIKGGDVIPLQIHEGVDGCDEALVLVSPASVRSQWVTFEIGAVWGQHKRVTPVLLGVKPDAVAPIQEIKAVDLNDVEQFLEQLKQRVSDSQKAKR